MSQLSQHCPIWWFLISFACYVTRVASPCWCWRGEGGKGKGERDKVKGKGNGNESSDKRSESSWKRKGMTHSSFWGLLYICTIWGNSMYQNMWLWMQICVCRHKHVAVDAMIDVCRHRCVTVVAKLWLWLQAVITVVPLHHPRPISSSVSEVK